MREAVSRWSTPPPDVPILGKTLLSCGAGKRWSSAVRRVLALTLAAACATGALCAGPPENAAAHRYYDVRGARFYVETFGNGAPIVFLHGGLRFFDTNFAKQRDYFASSRKVIGIDRSGHGHSPDTVRPFSYVEMAKDMAAIIEHLALGPVDVVGHSDGGNVGLILARDYPHLVRRLVVSGANLRAALSTDELKRRSEWTQQQIAEKARELGTKLPPNFRTEYEQVTPDGSEHWSTVLTKSYQLWLTPIVIEPADLKKIRIPVLVMAGDRDFTPIEETLEIYRGLPRAQLIVLPGTGHGTMSERPELANLVMREFFERP
jgi:pimeloyl-ACP methyl ester carboxylesterase